jgi:hypothetical protein
VTFTPRELITFFWVSRHERDYGEKNYWSHDAPRRRARIRKFVRLAREGNIPLEIP